MARLYTVNIKDEERFYMRILLLHVRGAVSFQSLRTVNDVVYETFKAAASTRGLLESDEEWNRCLTDGGTFLMPRQLREMFAYICCFCQLARPIKLWEDHVVNLTFDYMQTYPECTAGNKALHDINTIFKLHGLSCSMVGLPIPTGDVPQEEPYNQIEEARDSDESISNLNEKQLDAFRKIITAVDNENITSRYFYLDGPGGSEKTFLYTTLMAFIRSRGQVVLPFATIGIAATLLKGGRTVHSGFKLPLPLLDTSVSLMRMTSPEAGVLRQAALIIIDEITMLGKNGLRVIDKLMHEITGIDQPFGGKVFVVGGDFRQTLPVVPRGTRTNIIESCIKASRLWRNFTKLTLTINMRSEGQAEHNKWLLKVGMGNLPTVPGIFEEDTIQIPQQMVATEDLITSIFGNVQQMSVEDLSKRVILAPTNAQTLEMNRRIIELMPGNPEIYYSVDSVVSEDPNDTLNFPVEFLHDQTPSGIPPHVLLLKKGVIIMLLRNINPKKVYAREHDKLARNFIKAKIILECNIGDMVFILRIDLAPPDTTLLFIF